MKPQSIQKLFAFIITVMMFSALPQLASSQKNNPCPPGYKLKCSSPRDWPQWCTCVKNGNGNNSVVTSQELDATSFELEQTSKVSIKIYDATERLIKTLADRRMPQGEHQITWNKTDEAGNTVNAGIYIFRLDAGTFSDTKKFTVIK